MALSTHVKGAAILLLTVNMSPSGAPAEDGRVLVFSKTAGFRHSSIPEGIAAISRLGRSHRFGVDSTEDSAVFEDSRLAAYDAIVFLHTTGDVLDPAQEAAFERYIRAGGGFAGVHSAADTEYDWAWYGGLVGAYFASHPPIQPGAVLVTDRRHASTRLLPDRWVRTDEWYDFRANPRGRVHVLLRVDESSYSGGAMGADHPIAWAQFYDGGRSWYTALGHTEESFAEPLFLHHLLGGIRFAAGFPENDGARPRTVAPRP
ncbi:MAG: ThuA domain-containing protein [Thermoanaerobaculia bacterium]